MAQFRAKCMSGGDYALSSSFKYADPDVPLETIFEVGFVPKGAGLVVNDIGFVIGSDGAALAYVSSITETGYPVLSLMRAAPDLPVPQRQLARKAA